MITKEKAREETQVSTSVSRDSPPCTELVRTRSIQVICSLSAILYFSPRKLPWLYFSFLYFLVFDGYVDDVEVELIRYFISILWGSKYRLLDPHLYFWFVMYPPSFIFSRESYREIFPFSSAFFGVECRSYTHLWVKWIYFISERPIGIKLPSLSLSP